MKKINTFERLVLSGFSKSQRIVESTLMVQAVGNRAKAVGDGKISFTRVI